VNDSLNGQRIIYTVHECKLCRQNTDYRNGCVEVAEEAVERPWNQPGPNVLPRRVYASSTVHHAYLLSLRPASARAHWYMIVSHLASLAYLWCEWQRKMRCGSEKLASRYSFVILRDFNWPTSEMLYILHDSSVKTEKNSQHKKPRWR